MIEACPNLNDPEVAREFNELKEATSEKTAYNVWSLNNGYGIDKAPNGEPSILFRQLLNATKGNRTQAIRLKAKLYGNDFISQFGNWTVDSENVTGDVDLNGEPVYIYQNNKSQSNSVVNKYLQSSSDLLFIETDLQKLEAGDTVSSASVLNTLMERDLLSDSNVRLAKILLNHNIPVKFAKLKIGEMMSTVTDKSGNSVVLINPYYIGTVSNQLFSDSCLHEIVHALTVPAINNPQTEPELKLAKRNKDMFDLFDKLFPKELYDRTNRESGMYALCNEKEFAAEFITNKSVRDLCYQSAIAADKNSKTTIIDTLKRFINAVTNFLVNKKYFLSNKEKLDVYKNELLNYLFNHRIEDYSKYKPSVVFDIINSNLTQETVNNEDEYFELSNFGFAIDQFEKNNAIYADGRPFTEEEISKMVDETYERIAQNLQQRLAAIKSSNLEKQTIIEHSNLLANQIEQFKSKELSKFDVVSRFIGQVLPQLRQDCIYIRNVAENNGTISDTAYMYQMHDNFGTYNNILDLVASIISDNRYVVQYIADQIPTNPIEKQELVLKDMDTLANAVKAAQSLAKQGMRNCDSILINNMRKMLKDQAIKTGSLEMAEYINTLRSTSEDTSFWFTTFGSLDRASDEGLRTIFHMIDSALGQAQMKAQSKYTQLLKLSEQLPISQSVKMLYERDSDNQATGYLIRKYNYGQFFKDYNEFLSGLNLSYGLPLQNRTAPSGEQATRVDKNGNTHTWQEEKEKWLSQHCDRRFTSEYYKAYAGLSPETREKREEIQKEIRALKEKCLLQNGYYDYGKLNDAEFRRLQNLYIQKRILKSTYDISGNKKTGIELKIAQELQQLDITLNKRLKNTDRNKDAWNQKRIEVFNQCGGKEEYDKGSEGNFDFKTYNRWIERNCEQTLKRDTDGHILLYKRIQAEIEDAPVWEVDHDCGAQYKALQDKYNELLNRYRDFNTGDIMATEMTVKVSAQIRNLELEMSKLKKKAKAQNRNLAMSTVKYQKVFSKYAKKEYSALYKKLEQEAREGGYLDEFHKRTGYYTAEPGESATFNPYKWFTKVVPQEAYMDEFFEVTPGKGWIDVEEDSEFINKNFDESEGMTMVPKRFYEDENGQPITSRPMYDNSETYNQIIDEKGEPIGKLGELYKAILETIKESNGRYTNLQYHDNYLLPQIPGSMFDRMRAKGLKGKFNAAVSYLKDGIGMNDARYYDINQGQSVEDVLQHFDEFGDVVKQNDETNVSETVSGRRPDGRELHMVPQYYTRKLADPSQISGDLVGIVCEYYRQACTFENKQQIKDSCESMLDTFKNRKIVKTKMSVKHRKVDPVTGKKMGKWYRQINFGTREVQGDESNTYVAARHFINTHLYNMKQDASTVQLGAYSWNWGKFATAFRALTSAINLGQNLMVAGTGFITSTLAHTIQIFTGKRYSHSSAIAGTLEQIHQFFFTLNGVHNFVGNKTSTNKLMVLAETFNLSNQGERKRKHSQRNRLFNVVEENWCFGGMTMFDFIIKTNIMMSTLMEYRAYRGGFYTLSDIIQKNYNKSSEELEQLKKEWKDGKKLYDVISTDNGVVEIEEEYRNMYELVKDRLYASVNKFAEDVDGMATETQKAGIAANFVGASILTHRQYLPLMLQDRFGKLVYDEDTKQFEGGVFRSGWAGLKLLTMPMFDMLGLFHSFDSKRAVSMGMLGAGLFTVFDFALLSSPFSALSLLVGASYGVLASTSSKAETQFNSRFDDSSTELDFAKSKAERKNLKRIALELMLYNAMIMPLTNALCAYADKKDDDDDKIAMFIISHLFNLLNLDPDDNTTQMIAFLARRVQWEFYTPYRANDLFNNIKTPTAQTGTVDKIETALKRLWGTFIAKNALLDTFLTWFSRKNKNDQNYSDESEYVNRGLYSDSETRKQLLGDRRWKKWERDVFKIFPAHHLYEQINDSKTKRKYYENQIMQLNN